MKKSNFALRLSPSLMEEARKLAQAEGVAVNQLINVAVAEKVSASRTEEYFAERASRGDVKKALGLLKRAGKGRAPVAGDERPDGNPGRSDAVDKRRDGSIDDCLRFAIAKKRLIQFHYLGARRVAEPHDYGVRNGTTKLLVYQRHRSDGAPGASIRGWRLLDVSKIDRCSVLDESFRGSRGESHQRHYTWDVLYARVG